MRITFWWPAPVVWFVDVSSKACVLLRQVGQASGGAEALGYLENGSWQVLFLDRALPDLNAEELSALIRQKFPSVEIVLVDGDTDVEPATMEEQSPMRALRELPSVEPPITPRDRVINLIGESRWRMEGLCFSTRSEICR
jgi:CheY-like chemotaxis protein